VGCDQLSLGLRPDRGPGQDPRDVAEQRDLVLAAVSLIGDRPPMMMVSPSPYSEVSALRVVKVNASAGDHITGRYRWRNLGSKLELTKPSGLMIRVTSSDADFFVVAGVTAWGRC
jgi:hypothetical protein